MSSRKSCAIFCIERKLKLKSYVYYFPWYPSIIFTDNLSYNKGATQLHTVRFVTWLVRLTSCTLRINFETEGFVSWTARFASCTVRFIFRNNYTLFERFALYLLRGRNLNAFILSDISLWFCPIDISKLVIKKVFFLHQCHALFKYNPI